MRGAKIKSGWIISRIDNPGRSAENLQGHRPPCSTTRDLQTLSMSERALQASFLGMMSAVLKAVDIVSIVILLIMTPDFGQHGGHGGA